MDEKHLLYETKGNVAWITINREGQRNSITGQALELFLDYLDKAEKDKEVRVVCITGTGDKAFCSGADLGQAMGGQGQEALAVFKRYAAVLKRLASFPKPTVAKVNGACLAGGTGFMLGCDIVIAGSHARFGTPEVQVGLFPMMIGALIFRNVGRKKAMEMILLGEKLSADQALAMGMITRVVPQEDLEQATDSILKSLSAKSPLGMAIGKRAFHAVANLPLEESMDYLAEKLLEVASTKDAIEGITAFLEKRPPVFKGE
ncbi:MAG: enoyl-CoA hydratase-related protein [Desulfobacteraceae bacterium]|jgi:enoyl-CoA hydratase/carnithine racemase